MATRKNLHAMCSRLHSLFLLRERPIGQLLVVPGCGFRDVVPFKPEVCFGGANRQPMGSQSRNPKKRVDLRCAQATAHGIWPVQVQTTL